MELDLPERALSYPEAMMEDSVNRGQELALPGDLEKKVGDVRFGG
jgi:hypothetical protein